MAGCGRKKIVLTAVWDLKSSLSHLEPSKITFSSSLYNLGKRFINIPTSCAFLKKGGAVFNTSRNIWRQQLIPRGVGSTSSFALNSGAHFYSGAGITSALCHRAQHDNFRARDSLSITCSSSRHYCTGKGSSPKKITLPMLMDFQQIAWPNLFKSIKNWMLANFIITPYFDRDFHIKDFIEGSKQAVEFVSQSLAQGEFDKLQDVVSPEALREIKSTLSRYSIQQRSELAVNKDDIYFCFPYQVGVMFTDPEKEEQEQQRFVEITMCYHVLRGLKGLQGQSGKMPPNMANAEVQDKVFILNYRFIREFTKGVITPEWTVNIVNHYKPSDYV